MFINFNFVLLDMLQSPINSQNQNITNLANKGIKSTLIGIIASIVLAAIKGVAGILGNSYALIADAIESTHMCLLHL